jgi:hypothetical protein
MIRARLSSTVSRARNLLSTLTRYRVQVLTQLLLEL